MATRDLQPPVWKPSLYSMWEHGAQQGIETCSILGFASLCCCRNMFSALSRVLSPGFKGTTVTHSIPRAGWTLQQAGRRFMLHTHVLFSFGLTLFTTPGVIKIMSGLSTIDQVPPEPTPL